MRRGRVGGVGLFRVEGAGETAEREEGGGGGEEGGGGGEERGGGGEGGGGGGGGGQGGAGGTDDGFVEWAWDMIFWGTEDVCIYVYMYMCVFVQICYFR